MTGYNTYSTTPANNVQANTGINWDEGMSPGAVNNSARANMADTRTYANNPEWFQMGKGDGPYTPVYVASTQYKIAGADVSARYHVGRRTQVIGSGTGTIYGTISAVAFSTDTTVTVAWDSGSLSNEAFTSVSLGPAIANFPVSSMRLSTRQVLTSGSGATYTTPAGVRQLRIRMLGGGASGGQNSVAGGDGNAGGFSSFDNAGTNYKANGGGGGSHSGNGGAGGTGGTGGASPTTWRIPGASGVSGMAGAQTGGNGGASLLGGSPIGNTAAAANTGAGGGGSASSSGNAGGGGGAGEYVEIIINSPSASYTYTIGAGGTSGGTGSGAGGSGVIIVDEIY